MYLLLLNQTEDLRLLNQKYNNGWNVRATPESELYNYADENRLSISLLGKELDYDYLIHEKGFVVEKEEVELFLNENTQKNSE